MARRCGKLRQLSEPAVVLPAILTGSSFSGNDANKILMAMFAGLASEVMSEDCMYLAMAKARGYAKAMGIDDKTFDEGYKQVFQAWRKVRTLNPLHSMF